jgi:anti-sigma28 factor (negative regulator of flagellin synthesis)
MVAGEAAASFAIPREDNSHNLRLGRSKQLKELQEQQQHMLQKKLEEATLEKLEERKKAIRDMSYTMQQLEAERILKEEKQRKQKVTRALPAARPSPAMYRSYRNVSSGESSLLCRKTCAKNGAGRSR